MTDAASKSKIARMPMLQCPRCGVRQYAATPHVEPSSCVECDGPLPAPEPAGGRNARDARAARARLRISALAGRGRRRAPLRGGPPVWRPRAGRPASRPSHAFARRTRRSPAPQLLAAFLRHRRTPLGTSTPRSAGRRSWLVKPPPALPNPDTSKLSGCRRPCASMTGLWADRGTGPGRVGGGPGVQEVGPEGCEVDRRAVEALHRPVAQARDHPESRMS